MELCRIFEVDSTRGSISIIHRYIYIYIYILFSLSSMEERFFVLYYSRDFKRFSMSSAVGRFPGSSSQQAFMIPAKSPGKVSDRGRRSPLKTRAIISRGRVSFDQGFSLDRISHITTPKLYTSLEKHGTSASNTFRIE